MEERMRKQLRMLAIIAALILVSGAAFAATIVNGVQGTAGRIIGNVTGFTGGVTKATNPPPKRSYSGRSYSGGGRSCACRAESIRPPVLKSPIRTAM